MSLILDALRRADAERERGNVPGLHTPQPVVSAAVPAGGARAPVVLLSVLAGAVFAGGVAAWWHWRESAGAPAVVAVAPVAVPAPAPAPAPAAVVEPVVPAPALAPKRAEVVRLPSAPRTPAPVPVPAPVPAPVPVPVTPARIPTLQELSPGARQQLPSLAVSGASYSADPAYRMVIVNGQVLHEGEQAANGVLLESIAPRQVVFKGLGLRWIQGY